MSIKGYIAQNPIHPPNIVGTPAMIPRIIKCTIFTLSQCGYYSNHPVNPITNNFDNIAPIANLLLRLCNKRVKVM